MLRYAVFAGFLVGTAFLVWEVGQRGARAYERMLTQRIINGLEVLGYSWARIEADGLRVELHGHAPDSFERELAYEAAKATAPNASIQNFATATLAPPQRRDPVRIELHRDQRGVTMTGQTASREMRAELNALLRQADTRLPVRDLTGIQAAAPRRSLAPELRIASLAAASLPNAYVVVEQGKVEVDGQTADEASRQGLTQRLLNQAEDKVALVLRLRIPLEVIAPFGFSAYREPGGNIAIERCAVRTQDERALIEAALPRSGLEDRAARCRVGLGGPGGDWADAILASLSALRAVPAGRVDLEYRAARLVAHPPTAPDVFGTAQAGFADALPEGFQATARLEADDAATRSVIAREAYWMRIARTGNGIVLSGQVQDTWDRDAIATYAKALYGAGQVTTDLAVMNKPAPEDWRIAAMRGLDHLAVSDRGEVQMGGYGLEFRA